MGEHDRDGQGGHAEPHLDGGAGQGRDPHGLEPDRAQPSWRARRGGFDPDLRRMGRVAGGLALAGLAVAGGWSMLGRRPHEIPVIEAPSGPLRVRPENPGGMQLASGVDATPDGAGTLAPPPEVPQPGALRAQIQAEQGTQGLATGAAPDAAAAGQGGAAQEQAAQAAAQALAAQSLAAQLPVAQGGAAGASAAGGEVGGTSAAPVARGATPGPAGAAGGATPGAHVAARDVAHPPAAVAAAPAPAVAPVAARPDAAAAPGAHGAAVQLAAMESEQGATAEWQRLAHRMPELLGSRHPDVQRAEHDGHPVWRLRTGGFASTAQAAEFCAQVRAKGAACSVAAF